MSLTSASMHSGLEAAVFVSFVVATLSGAGIAVASRRLVRSVCGLALSFLGLAGLYYYLQSPFLSLMQILVYVGAICITIMFAMMLTDPQDQRVSRGRRLLRETVCLLVAGLLAAGLIVVIGRAGWVAPAPTAPAGTIQELGRALLYRYGFAFEVMSLVLLLASLGALVVARSGRRTKP